MGGVRFTGGVVVCVSDWSVVLMYNMVGFFCMHIGGVGSDLAPPPGPLGFSNKDSL